VSTRPVMSCESCRDLLIELVCDELPADTAAEARAHALTCERCGPELAKLEGTMQVASKLPLLAPSPEVERRIMQAARAAIAGKAKLPARERSHSESGLASWFARISAWAMSPQVAMASVLILVVGIGLYALPIGQAPETTALRATEDESEGAAAEPAAPSAMGAATPVPEADELQEQRRDRGTSAGELLGATPAARPRAEESAKAAPVARLAKPKAAKGGSYSLDDRLDGYGSDKGDSKPAVAERAASNAAPERKEYQEKAPADSASGAGRAGGFAPAPPASPAAAAPMPSQAPRETQGTEPAGAPPGASAQSEGEASEASKDSTQQLGQLAQGIAASQRGDYGQAEKLLVPVAKSASGSERTQANLWLARSYRAQGDCARAVPYYRTLTQSLSVSRDVLEEAADCFTRTGNEPQASKLRARAQQPTQQKSPD